MLLFIFITFTTQEEFVHNTNIERKTVNSSSLLLEAECKSLPSDYTDCGQNKIPETNKPNFYACKVTNRDSVVLNYLVYINFCTFNNNTQKAVSITNRNSYDEEKLTEIINSNFTGCTTATDGGAIYISSNVQKIKYLIENNSFIENKGNYGGALYFAVPYAIIRGCTFINNIGDLYADDLYYNVFNGVVDENGFNLIIENNIFHRTIDEKEDTSLLYLSSAKSLSFSFKGNSIDVKEDMEHFYLFNFYKGSEYSASISENHLSSNNPDIIEHKDVKGTIKYDFENDFHYTPFDESSSEPSSEPLEQSSEPLEPSSEPLEPSSEPLEPSSEPLEPSSEPFEQSSEPLEPSNEPLEPSSEPLEPTSEPSKPSLLFCSVSLPGKEDLLLYDQCYYESKEDEFSAIVRITNTNFSNLKTKESGSVVHITNCGFSCINSLFHNCTSDQCGGAIFIQNFVDLDNNVTFDHATFKECSALYGGAIYVLIKSDKNHVLFHFCNFFFNKATSPKSSKSEKYGGSAIFITSKEGNIENCTFQKNTGAGGSVKIYNLFDESSSILTEKEQAIFFISSCIFEMDEHSKSSIYYISDRKESLMEITQCSFKGKLENDSNYIIENLIGKDVPKISIQSCIFEHKSNDYVKTKIININENPKVKNHHAWKFLLLVSIFIVSIASLTALKMKNIGMVDDRSVVDNFDSNE